MCDVAAVSKSEQDWVEDDRSVTSSDFSLHVFWHSAKNRHRVEKPEIFRSPTTKLPRQFSKAAIYPCKLISRIEQSGDIAEVAPFVAPPRRNPSWVVPKPTTAHNERPTGERGGEEYRDLEGIVASSVGTSPYGTKAHVISVGQEIDQATRASQRQWNIYDFTHYPYACLLEMCLSRYPGNADCLVSQPQKIRSHEPHECWRKNSGRPPTSSPESIVSRCSQPSRPPNSA